MKEKIKAWSRPSGKWTDIYVIAVCLTVIMLYSGTIITELLCLLLPVEKAFGLLTASDSVAEFMYLYFIYLGIWPLFFLICGVFRQNRPILGQLKPNRNGNSLKGALIGLLLGFGANGICILFSVWMGDIHLFFNGFDPILLFAFFFLIAVQSGGEEIGFRAYLYQKLRRRYRNPFVAIMGNSVLFAAMHLFNTGITVLSLIEIIVTGLFCSLLVYYYDSLWAAIAFHTAWNFTQNIVFGLPNSGFVSEYSLFALEAASAENGLFYNVNFGVEGSIGAVLIEALLVAAIMVINRGKPEKHDVWANTEATEYSPPSG